MEQNESIEANRRMGNETADVHAQVHVDGLAARIQAPDSSTFDEIEKRLFADIGLDGWGKERLSFSSVPLRVGASEDGLDRVQFVR